MEDVNMTTVVIVIILGLALVVFLFLKNQKDKKAMNPDAPVAVEEDKMEHGHKDKL